MHSCKVGHTMQYDTGNALRKNKSEEKKEESILFILIKRLFS